MNNARLRTLSQWVFLILCLVALDQLSKATVINNFPEIFVKNFGSAFSIMFPINLTILLSVVFVIFVTYLVSIKKEPHGFVWGLSVSGAIGNLIDRVSLGYVVDFIHVGRFPVFNVADIYLTVSAALLIYLYIIKKN